MYVFCILGRWPILRIDSSSSYKIENMQTLILCLIQIYIYFIYAIRWENGFHNTGGRSGNISKKFGNEKKMQSFNSSSALSITNIYEG